MIAENNNIEGIEVNEDDDNMDRTNGFLWYHSIRT